MNKIISDIEVSNTISQFHVSEMKWKMNEQQKDASACELIYKQQIIRQIEYNIVHILWSVSSLPYPSSIMRRQPGENFKSLAMAGSR